MLKNIDPLLSPELLSALRAMGHGDEIAIVDANYPAICCASTSLRLRAWVRSNALHSMSGSRTASQSS